MESNTGQGNNYNEMEREGGDLRFQENLEEASLQWRSS